jgi:hypothetical protein
MRETLMPPELPSAGSGRPPWRQEPKQLLDEMDARAELQPGEPGRGGLVGPGVACAGARPEDLFQDAAEGEHRREVYHLSEPPCVLAGELAVAEAGEQLSRGRLAGPVLTLELQAAGKIPHPGRGAGSRRRSARSALTRTGPRTSSSASLQIPVIALLVS